MPGIRKPNIWNPKIRYGIPKEHDVDFDPHVKYCQSCLEVGIRSELKKRVYRVEPADKGNKLVPEVTAPDADRFRQCHRCGDVVPIYNVKTESALVDFVEPTKNPFDDNADKLVKLERTSRLTKNKTSKYKRKRDQINSIKDPDIRRELADGQTQLVSYSDH